jgi:hypothetical protein
VTCWPPKGDKHGFSMGLAPRCVTLGPLFCSRKSLLPLCTAPLSCTVMAGLCPEGTFVRNVLAVTEALGQAVATVL